MQSSTLPKKLGQFFVYFLKQQKIGFILLLFTMTSWSVQESFFPYFIKVIVDAVSVYDGDKSLIFSYLSGKLIIALLFLLFIEINFRTNDFLMCKVYPRFMSNMRATIFDYVQHHSHSFFVNNFAGTIASKIARLPEASQKIIDEFITVFWPVTITIIISCILLFLEKPFFAYVVIVWFISQIAITLAFSHKCQSSSMHRFNKLTALNGKIVDNVSNIMNVRLFARHKYEKKYLDQYQQEEMQAFDKSLFYNALMKLCLGLSSLTFVMTMVGGALYFYSQNKLSVGDVALILSYYNLIGLTWFMCMEFVIFYELIGACNDALSVVIEDYNILDEPDAKVLQVVDGRIEFKDVTFTYIRNQNVFHNKSIAIMPKQKVGLVGFSGSGKTTFVNLILRYFDVVSGSILIDGQNISEVTQDSLRNSISIIPQDPSLFHRTLLENIRYGKLDATEEEVIEAAKSAYIHDFIMELPEKYNTLVGERGTKLSGGQRQRIAMARAILKNAPILILDEATSSLDSITESNVQNSLANLMQGKTVIVIAHRLSTLLNMDRILVFEHGHIVEDGDHKTLLKQPHSHYATLWNMQAGGFLPEKED
ncbi:Putative multidrug export ATP-binding/permease protein [Rickettsiales bacterium Ac37b]|nr:Putative multidrug export ATP-binding/permease protein [Rickettsiales bacterium Ac37b]